MTCLPAIHTLTVFQSINFYLAEIQGSRHAHGEGTFRDGITTVCDQNLHAALEREKAKCTFGHQHANLVCKPAFWIFHPTQRHGLFDSSGCRKHLRHISLNFWPLVRMLEKSDKIKATSNNRDNLMSFEALCALKHFLDSISKQS